MKAEYTISVFTENRIGLLNRVSSIFSRRQINVESITCSDCEIEHVHRYTICVKMTEEQIKKIVAQLNKQIEVIQAFYYEQEEIVCQELALYKVPTTLLARGGQVERMLRDHGARILSIEPEYTILEKTGYPTETQELFEELEPYGILEFARSGRVAISKPMKELKNYLASMNIKSAERVSNNNN